MEILFKDYLIYFFIKDNVLDWSFINFGDNLDNIKHIDNAEVLYHYINLDGDRYQVYYEHNNQVISKKNGNKYCEIIGTKHLIKDHTLTNLKLI